MLLFIKSNQNQKKNINSQILIINEQNKTIDFKTFGMWFWKQRTNKKSLI